MSTPVPSRIPPSADNRITELPPTSRSTAVRTLADLEGLLPTMTLTKTRRQDAKSALRTVGRALRRPLHDIPAQPERLRQLLREIIGPELGISRGRWANVRSILKAVLQQAGVPITTSQPLPLAPEWAALMAQLPTRSLRIRLSRLLRHLSARGFGPSNVSLQNIHDFREELRSATLLRDPDHTWKITAGAWNIAARTVQAWPRVPVPLETKRRDWLLPWSAFPATLHADVLEWQKQLLAGASPFAPSGSDAPRRGAACRPSTANTRAYQLRMFATAAVLNGVAADTIATLADLVAADVVRPAVEHLITRYGEKGSQNAGILLAVQAVARHKVRAATTTLEFIAGPVSFFRRKQAKGFTPKNRTRLRQFDNRDRQLDLLRLPKRLRAEADGKHSYPVRAALLAQLAVALELLMTAPMRFGNLVALDLDRHVIRDALSGSAHIHIPAAEVKNNTNLDYPLLPVTVALLDWYIERHRPHLVCGESRMLFPGRNGRAKDISCFRRQVVRIVRLCTGLQFNPHLARALAGKIHLDRHRGEYETVRRVLNHKSLQTTVDSYVSDDTAAHRHFQGLIHQLREGL